SERKAERDARPASSVRTVAQPQGAAVRLDEATTDVQPETGARDPRLAHVARPVERLEDEAPVGLGHSDALVVDGRHEYLAIDTRPDRDRRPGRRILLGVCDEVLEHLADATRVDVDGWQIGPDLDYE